ncbi:MAG: hypothetical protein V2I43_02605, partial [Parvularcula sp.]|nr:hypothetical protein [Parvularcula sp.]
MSVAHFCNPAIASDAALAHRFTHGLYPTYLLHAARPSDPCATFPVARDRIRTERFRMMRGLR